MTESTAGAGNEEQKGDAAWTQNLMHQHFKALCFAGLFPYEEICNTPRKAKLYRVYQFGIYLLYIPLLLSQMLKLYHKPGNLFVIIETVTHVAMGAAAYLSPFFVNWNEAYNLMRKFQIAIISNTATRNNSKKMQILKETKRKAEYVTSTAFILGQATVICDLCDVFILYLIEYLVGLEHTYKTIPDISNIYVTLLLQKYPFSSWVPYDETSIIAHLMTYLYAIFPLIQLAFRVGVMTSTLMGICMYSALQFQFVSMSLENLNDMEDTACVIQNKAFNIKLEHGRYDALHYGVSKLSNTFEESNQRAEKEKDSQLRKKKTRNGKVCDPVDFAKDTQQFSPGDKLSPVDCLIDIIRDHQEAIR
jgi:hypothetical protein